MQKLHFSTEINASKEKVWEMLWSDATYSTWTKAFSEGSIAVTDWQEGSKVQFLNADGDGMFGVIETVRENEFMSFKHLGYVKKNVEQPIEDEAQKWSGSYENYNMTEKDGVTTLNVELDATEDFLDFFNEKFPIALEIVKNLAESKANAAG
jgi:uncharacterized protein YndB with AHSA1/START domain